ncbi:MAG: virulence RhuM family protein [Tatlockia sp.]|nr:virulence RhuM family protein [Tatlockia sp.]
MSNTTDNQKQVLIYQAEDGSYQTEIRLESDNIWLNQKQMSELFNTSTDNIGLHIKNVYSDGELNEEATTEDYSVVRFEGKRKVNRRIKHYNLDTIISVGYRVNSKQGTQFRIWANKILKEYLLQGYALNESRLTQQTKQISQLKETLALFQEAQQMSLGHVEAKGLLSVLTEYTHSFILLNQYDTDNFPKGGALIIWFLQRNKHLLKRNGEAKINDNALVAITLLVAQSQPNQKEIIIDLIINLIKEGSAG